MMKKEMGDRVFFHYARVYWNINIYYFAIY